MKICLVSHNILKGDGQGRVNYELAKFSIEMGHEVTLVSSKIAPDLAEDDRINWVKINRSIFPTQLVNGLLFAIQSSSWLKKSRSQFDLVQVNGANTNAPGDINTVHFVHSSWLKSKFHPWKLSRTPRNYYQWFYTYVNAILEKSSFQRSSQIVAVSEKVKQDLIDIDVPSSKIHVLLNGVDLDEFSPGVGDRAALGLPESVSIALFIGDLRTTRKNLDTVLKALVKVPDLHLVVVGATERSLYPKISEELGLQERVHFLGYRRDIASIMKATDFFVFPSRYEACTLVLLEALASGLPVITATSTGGSEIIDSSCGIVLDDSESVEALTIALKTMSGDREKIRSMGPYARQMAERYSWKYMSSNYLRIFASYLSDNSFLKSS